MYEITDLFLAFCKMFSETNHFCFPFSLIHLAYFYLFSSDLDITV